MKLFLSRMGSELLFLSRKLVLKYLFYYKKWHNFQIMRRYLTYLQFLLFVLLALLLSACEKQEYDLFPLKVGNEFYFTYYKYRFNGISSYTNGNERWKVISVSSQGNSDIYTIERKLDAVLKVAGQTILITDSLRFFEINEEKTSSLLSSSTNVKKIANKKSRRFASHDPYRSGD